MRRAPITADDPLLRGTHRQSCCVCTCSRSGARWIAAISTKIRINPWSCTAGGRHSRFAKRNPHNSRNSPLRYCRPPFFSFSQLLQVFQQSWIRSNVAERRSSRISPYRRDESQLCICCWWMEKETIEIGGQRGLSLSAVPRSYLRDYQLRLRSRQQNTLRGISWPERSGVSKAHVLVTTPIIIRFAYGACS